MPMDRCNLSQQIPVKYLRIFAGHGVATCDQEFFPSSTLAQDAVNKEPPIASVKCEITRLCLLKIIRLNSEVIPRPQRGQHADSGSSQLQCPGGTQDLGCQIAPAFFLGQNIHGAGCYEFFWFNRHSPGSSFWQAKANVSNTRSYRNSGLEYGFLPAL
jgi:hypothetical protein